MTAAERVPGEPNAGTSRKLPLQPITGGRSRDALQVVTSAMRPPAIPNVPIANPMAVLIDLEVEARGCLDVATLRYAIVNATRKLIPYDQAFLLEWASASQSWKISVASSIANVDRHATVPRALESWLNNPQQPLRQTIDKIQSADITIGEQSIELSDGDTVLPNAIWVPLRLRTGITVGLLALRERPWEPAYHNLLLPLAGAYAHAWDALTQADSGGIRQTLARLSRRRLAIGCAVFAALAAFMPIPMTALAPAEIVAASPELIVAPMDGVIQDILVPSGAEVEKGTVLVRFADTKVRNDFELAAKAKTVAEAKYFKVLQSAVSTQKDMQDLSVTKAELAMAEADLAYAREMLSRVDVKASHAGLVIYTAKSDWIGRPVSTGERIMEIADPDKTEIKIDVQVSDAITVKPGARVALFLDGEPLQSVDAVVERMTYRPITTPDNQLVFRLSAKFTDSAPRRIGLRGTARLSGDTVTLGFYLLRRPLALVRQKIGL
jgi:multidrug resistance efflux pump